MGGREGGRKRQTLNHCTFDNSSPLSSAPPPLLLPPAPPSWTRGLGAFRPFPLPHPNLKGHFSVGCRGHGARGLVFTLGMV